MKQTLSSQIKKTIFLVSVVSVTSCSLIYYVLSTKQFKENMLEYTIIDAKFIGDQMIMPLEFNNGERAFEILSKLKAKPKIEKAILFDAQGIVLSHYMKSTKKLEVPDFYRDAHYYFSGNYLHVHEPIQHDGKYYGTLYLKAKVSIQELLIEQGLVTLIIILVLTIFIFFLAKRFQKKITAPIMYLITTIKSVSRFKDYTIRLELERDEDDEISNLYSSFNKMQEAIHEREKELIESRKKAEEADLLKSAFLANMSHEIRTPLNAIVGFTNLINDTKLSPEEIKNFSQIIQNRSKDLLDIIDDIISIAKIEAGQMTLHKQNFNVDELIDDLADDYRQRIDLDYRKKINLIVKRERATASNVIESSPKAIKQMLSNLLSNALKFTEEGEIVLSYSLKPKQITFTVSDTGIGIDKEDQELIFERFRQVEEYQTRNYGGTGLGLSICNALINQLKGKMNLKSTKGKGSAFSFSIPLDYSMI